MIEARKCVRCGSMYVSDTEVCDRCQKKDGADLYKLKGFLENEEGAIFSKTELAAATGISNKNLSRFLNYDEFKGLNFKVESIAASGKLGIEQEINNNTLV